MTGEKRQEELIDAARERNFAAELRGKGYVVLKPEEAAKVMDALRRCYTYAHHDSGLHALIEPALVLLNPDDIGPPAPGEGHNLPNPEQGMKC